MALIKPIYNLLSKFRVLFRPMFFLSLIFHIGFLSLPLPSSPKLEEKKTEEQEEIQEKVEITRLIPPSPQPSPETPKTPPKVKSTPTPQPIQRPPTVRQIPRITTPSPSTQITATPEKTPLQINPEPSPSPTPKQTPTPTPKVSESPTPTPTPTINPELIENDINNLENQNEVASEAGSSLLEELRPRILKRLEKSSNDLDAMKEYIDTLPIQFIRDEHIPYFLTAENKLKVGTLGFLTIPQTSPYGAYFDYIEPVVKNELGFEINQLEEQYGDSLFYEAKNSSDVTFYMSIVKLKGSGALLILWIDNPQVSQASE
ncbi:hypothetical protein [Crocosphaera chwakensis]|uniref:Uncharacterized protein n=1 Tax=Crocosphaera chwakensis CCY0110 TaxID=391612 RepID=A3IVV1_9CHRO|nr:hypothetical protein [Crocosphaera chwakensis]EAZ89412.1 hypothetical protein CY0110_12282 [Crocosphaera chwakensis CCY0110]